MTKNIRREFAIDDPALQVRHLGDRRDGVWLRDVDSMHTIMPFIYKNRTNNEAFIAERIDLTPINQYLETLNQGDDVFRYTMFHVLVAAMLKTVALRPRMNRFICNKKLYQRRHLSAAFVVRKYFDDKSDEGLAFIHADPQDTIFTLHEKLRKQIYPVKKGQGDTSSDAMDVINRLPFPLVRILMGLFCFMEKHGWLPQSLIGSDPAYSSCFFTNLGSIRLKSGYHHLNNWGTNSLFIVVGEKKKRPTFQEDGTWVEKEYLDLGFTVDERIADGYYYSKTIRVLKNLLEHPELLELPLVQEIEE